MTADTQAWLESVERRKDDLKTAITSNGRLLDGELAELASTVETVYKRCRQLAEDAPS